MCINKKFYILISLENLFGLFNFIRSSIYRANLVSFIRLHYSLLKKIYQLNHEIF